MVKNDIDAYADSTFAILAEAQLLSGSGTSNLTGHGGTRMVCPTVVFSLFFN
jgi:hypothetical protein